jgi:hypothetical protein
MLVPVPDIQHRTAVMAIESTSFEEPRVGLEPTPQNNERLEHNGHATEARNEGRQPMPVPGASVDGIAQALGWFSVGLGVAELLAPRNAAPRFGRAWPATWRISRSSRRACAATATTATGR